MNKKNKYCVRRAIHGLPFEINEFLFSFIPCFLKRKTDTKIAVISEKSSMK